MCFQQGFLGFCINFLRFLGFHVFVFFLPRVEQIFLEVHFPLIFLSFFVSRKNPKTQKSKNLKTPKLIQQKHIMCNRPKYAFFCDKFQKGREQTRICTNSKKTSKVNELFINKGIYTDVQIPDVPKPVLSASRTYKIRMLDWTDHSIEKKILKF